MSSRPTRPALPSPIDIRSDELLSHNRGRLQKVTFDITRRDGGVVLMP
jgi:hypothetical protein